VKADFQSPTQPLGSVAIVPPSGYGLVFRS
jgi:hypothetical protein